jgi:hypothetical protein
MCAAKTCWSSEQVPWRIKRQCSHAVDAVMFVITCSKPKFDAGLGLCSIAAGMLGAKSVVATDLRRAPCPCQSAASVFVYDVPVHNFCVCV